MRPTLVLLGAALLIGGCYQSATHAPPEQTPPVPSGRAYGGEGPAGAGGADARDPKGDDAGGEARPAESTPEPRPAESTPSAQPQR